MNTKRVAPMANNAIALKLAEPSEGDTVLKPFAPLQGNRTRVPKVVCGGCSVTLAYGLPVEELGTLDASLLLCPACGVHNQLPR